MAQSKANSDTLALADCSATLGSTCRMACWMKKIWDGEFMLCLLCSLTSLLSSSSSWWMNIIMAQSRVSDPHTENSMDNHESSVLLAFFCLLWLRELRAKGKTGKVNSVSTDRYLNHRIGKRYLFNNFHNFPSTVGHHPVASHNAHERAWTTLS